MTIHAHILTRPTLSSEVLGCQWPKCPEVLRLGVPGRIYENGGMRASQAFPAPHRWPRIVPEKPVLAQESSRTSVAAAQALPAGRRANLRQAVLDAIRAAPDGLTAERVSETTGIGGDTVRPRIVELCERNLIVRSGKTRLTKSGRDAECWVAR